MGGKKPLRSPQLLDKATRLADELKKLSAKELMKYMHVSLPLAEKTQTLMHKWSVEPESQSLALDTFLGDIYSGLHATDLSQKERDYADNTLLILSGLYGCIRPYDGICPYRLEMGYTRSKGILSDLYAFWSRDIADCLPDSGLIVNLAAVEYSKTITPFVDPARVVSPYFLTENPTSAKPEFVVVHAKIARGAFARWLITSRVDKASELPHFTDLGYVFNKDLSTPAKPVFVCKEFGGKGLSIRLS